MSEKLFALACKLHRIQKELDSALQAQESAAEYLSYCEKKVEHLDEEKMKTVDEIVKLVAKNSNADNSANVSKININSQFVQLNFYGDSQNVKIH